MPVNSLCASAGRGGTHTHTFRLCNCQTMHFHAAPRPVWRPRSGRGNYARPSRQPAQPLVFWGYEVSPFVKLAREVLCELELPYLYRTAARGSAKRQELLDKRGTFQVGRVGPQGAKGA